MIDINTISPVDVSTTQQTSSSDQADSSRRVPQPSYETTTKIADDDSVLSRNAPSLPTPQRINGELAGVGLDTITDNVVVDFTAIAIMLVKLNQEAEKASRDAVVQDILSVSDQMEKSADDIRAGAGLALAGGIISGAGQIASGGISIAGGVQSYRIASQAAATEEPATTSTKEESVNTETEETSATSRAGMSETELAEGQTRTSAEGETETTRANTEETVEDVTEELTNRKAELNKLGLTNLKEQNQSFIISQKANSISLKTQGYSQIMTGASQSAAAGFKYGSDQMEAQSKKDEAHAEKSRSWLEREKQYADSLHKSSQDMTQTLADVLQSQHQTTSQVMQSRV